MCYICTSSLAMTKEGKKDIQAMIDETVDKKQIKIYELEERKEARKQQNMSNSISLY